MAAYLIVTREGPVTDAEEYATYQRKTREGGRGDLPIEPLVIHGAVAGLEGTPPDTVVVLKFPDPAAAQAWYDSPNYQAALPHRIAAGDWRAFIVEGFAAP
jgi:uncharacterized protein (DUF1330 family)